MITGIILTAIFGLIIGSFLNVVILRLPEEQSLLGHSRCMHCGHELGPLDLVPLFSFIFLRGKCRYCRKPISSRYFFIELSTAALFAISYLFFPAAMTSKGIDQLSLLLLLRALIVVAVLIVVFVIDYEHYLILDKIVYPSSLILLGINIYLDLLQHNPAPQSLTLISLLSSLGLFLFFGAIYFFSNGRWMGFGDVKFSIFLGLATPYPYLILNIFLSFMIGAVFGSLLMLFGGKKMSSHLPFGTFLAISSIIILWFGDPLLNWYLSLIGLRY